MPTTLLLVPLDFPTFLRPCITQIHQSCSPHGLTKNKFRILSKFVNKIQISHLRARAGMEGSGLMTHNLGRRNWAVQADRGLSSIFQIHKLEPTYKPAILQTLIAYNIALESNGMKIFFIARFARLITYFGNFVFGFSSLRLCDFMYDVFRLQGKMGKTK